jgi:Phytanoyl-CoA dioxygenase (PhyH)
MTAPLTSAEVDAFVRDGFVCLREAFPRALADECRAELWDAIGLSRDRPDEWTQRVIWLTSPWTPAFDAVIRSPRLEAAFDQLVGVGRWHRLAHLGGHIPIRFPVDEEPDDNGWHLDTSLPEGRVNLRSEGKALLLLVLFSEVGDDDAATRILVGSHRDVPRVVAPAGEEGMAFSPPATLRIEDYPLARATGSPGDVYLCHPFLVHAADRHRGTEPRFMAQPGLPWHGSPATLDGPIADSSPVERAIRLGLGAG